MLSGFPDSWIDQRNHVQQSDHSGRDYVQPLQELSMNDTSEACRRLTQSFRFFMESSVTTCLGLSLGLLVTTNGLRVEAHAKLCSFHDIRLSRQATISLVRELTLATKLSKVTNHTI
jgi:hypothetical protein